jgi:hypothetical protein
MQTGGTREFVVLIIVQNQITQWNTADVLWRNTENNHTILCMCLLRTSFLQRIVAQTYDPTCCLRFSRLHIESLRASFFPQFSDCRLLLRSDRTWSDATWQNVVTLDSRSVWNLVDAHKRQVSKTMDLFVAWRSLEHIMKPLGTSRYTACVLSRATDPDSCKWLLQRKALGIRNFFVGYTCCFDTKQHLELSRRVE